MRCPNCAFARSGQSPTRTSVPQTSVSGFLLPETAAINSGADAVRVAAAPFLRTPEGGGFLERTSMSEATHPYDTAVGALLREQRLEALVKQRDLAEALDVTRATVTRWEQGIRGLNIATLLTLADTLGIPGSYLLPEAHREKLDPSLAAIVRNLRERPDLVPTVQALLETLMNDENEQLEAQH